MEEESVIILAEDLKARYKDIKISISDVREAISEIYGNSARKTALKNQIERLYAKKDLIEEIAEDFYINLEE